MPPKAIPPARDRLQSRTLVWIVMPILCLSAAITSASLTLSASHTPTGGVVLLESLGVSICFAMLAWRLRAATPMAAGAGGIVCLSLLYGTQSPWSPLAHSALIPLFELFVLTFLATRAGRKRKAVSGLAESRTGRTTSQVVANLGGAAMLALPLGGFVLSSNFDFGTPVAAVVTMVAVRVGVLAALAEATADTVSSEIGQAFGGNPVMLTTMRRVKPGTDGAISVYGTFAGIAAAAIIVATGIPALGMSFAECLVAFIAGVLGLFFDSLLGATVERNGWMGNDLVNFTSTAFAAAVALLAIGFGRDFLVR